MNVRESDASLLASLPISGPGTGTTSVPCGLGMGGATREWAHRSPLVFPHFRVEMSNDLRLIGTIQGSFLRSKGERMEERERMNSWDINRTLLRTWQLQFLSIHSSLCILPHVCPTYALNTILPVPLAFITFRKYHYNHVNPIIKNWLNHDTPICESYESKSFLLSYLRPIWFRSRWQPIFWHRADTELARRLVRGRFALPSAFIIADLAFDASGVHLSKEYMTRR